MIEVLAQATDQATQAAAQPGGITGSIQGGLGCLGAAIGVGIVGMKGAEAVGRNPMESATSVACGRPSFGEQLPVNIEKFVELVVWTVVQKLRRRKAAAPNDIPAD